MAQHLPRGLFVLVVAGEDRLAADQKLAVLGSTNLEAGQRRADAAEAEAIRPVDRGRGCALRQAPALDDQDVERVEEFTDLFRERRAAGDAEAQPSAQPVLHLAVDEPVGEPVA